MQCVGCQSPITPDTKFCPQCGLKQVKQSTKPCPSCSKTIQESANFCEFCGAKLGLGQVLLYVCPCGESYDQSQRFCSVCGKANPTHPQNKDKSEGQTQAATSNVQPTQPKSPEPMDTSADGARNLPDETNNDELLKENTDIAVAKEGLMQTAENNTPQSHASHKQVMDQNKSSTVPTPTSEAGQPGDGAAGLMTNQQDDVPVGNQLKMEVEPTEGSSKKNDHENMEEKPGLPYQPTDTKEDQQQKADSGINMQTGNNEVTMKEDDDQNATIVKESTTHPLDQSPTMDEKHIQDSPELDPGNPRKAGDVSTQPRQENDKDDVQISVQECGDDTKMEHKKRDSLSCNNEADVAIEKDNGSAKKPRMNSPEGTGKYEPDTSQDADMVGVQTRSMASDKTNEQQRVFGGAINDTNKSKEGLDKDEVKSGSASNSPGNKETKHKGTQDKTDVPTSQTAPEVPGATAYNKNKTQPPDYHTGGQKSGKGKGAKTSGERQYGNEMIDVYFHVAVSRDFKFKEDKHQIELRSCQLLGDWSQPKWRPVFSVVRMLGESFPLMTLQLRVFKSALAYGTRIEYKYIRCKKSGDLKGEYEFLYKNSKLGVLNRSFHIPPDDLKSRNDWHQFDGVMHCKPSQGLLSQIYSYVLDTEYKPLTNEAKEAANAMLPDLKDVEKIPAYVLLDKVAYLETCFKSQLLEKNLITYSRDLFIQVLSGYISRHAETLKATDADKGHPDTDAMSAYRLAMAMTIICICAQYNIVCDTAVLNVFAASLDSVSKKKLDLNGLVDIHFPKGSKTNKTVLLQRLLNYIGMIKYDVKWILAVPFVHFLSGKVQPGVQPQLTRKHNTKQWWCIEEFSDVVDKVKDYKKFKKEFADILLQTAAPLFEADVMLPRTVMALLSWEHIEIVLPKCQIDAVICLANLYYFLDNKKLYELDFKKIPKLLQHVNKKIQMEQELVLQNRSSMVQAVKDQMVECGIAMDFVNLVLQYRQNSYRTWDYSKVVLAATQTFIHILEKCEKTVNACKSELSEKAMKDCISRLEEKWANLMDNVKAWYCKNQWFDFVKTSYRWEEHRLAIADVCEVEVLSNILHLNVHSNTMGNRWRDTFIAVLKGRIANEIPGNRIAVFCLMEYDKFHPLIEDCCMQMAFDGIDSTKKGGLENFNHVFSCMEANKKNMDKFKDVISRLFVKGWPHPAEHFTVMKHMLSWPTYLRYLGIFFGNEDNTKLLNEECQTLVTTSLSFLDMTQQQLRSGDVSLPMLKLILEYKQQFLEIVAISDKEKTKAEMTLLMDLREAELQWYTQMQIDLSSFLAYCDQFQKVEVATLQNEISADFSKLRIKDICIPRDAAKVQSVETAPDPNITAFKVSQDVLKILPDLKILNQSVTFAKLSKSYNKFALSQKTTLTMDEVVTQVFQPALKRLRDIEQKLSQGLITLGEVDKIFGSFRQDNLRSEFEVICQRTDKGWIDKRLEEIQQYHQLNTYRRGADVMENVRKDFNLTGDFTTLSILANAGSDKTLPLKKIDKNVAKAGQDLKDIGEDESQCIAALHKCHHLVTWLRENAKSIKEVKTLVDLAMMSAQGQGAMEVQKVSCLHAAATGYGPLIYELKNNAGFKEFLGQCKLVWRALAKDNHLPKHLIDTNRNLQWLKDVKESHGSVEVNALTQATNINSRGIYRVGHISEKEAANRNHVKSHNSVIKLFLFEKTEERTEKKEYSYEQLCDLQSKLMLVAGKAEQGNEEVQRFVQILDGVTRLATAYIKLNKAGCILFKQWNATFHCEPTKPVHTEIDFGNKTERIVMRGMKADTPEVGDEIKSICKFMEDCYMAWTNQIDNERRKFYFLNCFTTEQLVILCTEIAKFINKNEKHSPRIFSMLERVKQNCSKEDLSQAITVAFRDLQTKSDDTMDDDDEEASSDEMETEDVEALKLAFINEMKSANYSEQVALKALEAVGDPADTDNGLLWCIEHSDEVAQAMDTTVPETEPGNTERTTDIDLSDFIRTETLDQLKEGLLMSTKDKSQALQKKLRDLWELYMQSSSDISVSDFLSVHHLGYILENLHKADTQPVFERVLPSSCFPGKGNLIICPESEVLQVCLSIYMEEKGRHLSLPTETEVLLCTSETRAEEVELLLRRAFGLHKGRKLFCLVNADRLEYDVGVQVEKFYETQSRGILDFQLVIICAKEREDKSTIATAFERYRVNKPVRQNIEHIQQYIIRNLHVPEGMKPNPVAQLDPERCSVRVVKSHRAGVGKSLKASRLAYAARDLNKRLVKDPYVRVNMHRTTIDVSDILHQLLEYTSTPEQPRPRLFHLDIAHEVQEGVDDLLFNLVILGSISDQEGYVWRRSPYDLYIIESMPIMLRDQWAQERNARRQKEAGALYAHQVFQFLPSLTCWSPTESRDILAKQNAAPGSTVSYKDYQQQDQLMDLEEFMSPAWQRVYQYLHQFDQGVNDFTVDVDNVTGDTHNCLEVLLRHCGLRDPSWAELRHFVWFLNIQLVDCDLSEFCGPILAQDLPGFKQFVVKSMIQMSRDFATRSLNLSEETPSTIQTMEEEADELAQFQLKRTWESSPHPYVFFNADRNSMTFLGFNIGPNGEMIDQQTKLVLEHNVMAKPLKEALVRNYVPLNENFDTLHRYAKIDKIHRIMGIPEGTAGYPDESYVLTTDNVKKIMAIYMRFRCGIPVIIMGETGCGKTRLIKFMCDLQKPMDGPEIQNMILMKVHGGTTAQDIERKLQKALTVADVNRKRAAHIDTVMFFDEANTTEEIGKIKRVMVDNDNEIQHTGLKIVAACNPYRKHSDEMIRRLEQAGLGYHIQADATTDKLGQVPMRRLVYRVQALPQSMLPLVWDFGQLDINTETRYIQEMVNKCVNDKKLPDLPNLQQTLSNILAASQNFMRQQEDECSFVSLRDVERVLRVTCWFYEHRDRLFDAMNELAEQRLQRHDLIQHADSEDEMEEEEEDGYQPVDNMTRSLVLALGVCYHACLDKRREYRKCVAPHFDAPLSSVGEVVIEEEINGCQDVFLNELVLEENIARNQALKENVFMMVVCIELRIPLFLVGKPGSSKSLAKTIVADAMQGDASRSDLFKEFKSVHMVSYQCSPLATPQGIVGTFRQCADLQQKKDLDKFVSVVVLDEVGLAEDSPRMPLKALHPLLEDGCEGDEDPEPYKKVAFIGISNWALDPAKMNRGILVQRGVPNEIELEESAKGICASDLAVQNRILSMIKPMAKAYLQLYDSALEIREFFGLRDFYSIIKMVYGFAKRSGKTPTWYELKHSILRNFGGLDNVEPMEVFEKVFTNIDKNAERLPLDPDCTPAGLIKACLFGEGLQGISSESRYLLILTENYAALKILQQELLRVENAQYIFGSSFPKDQEYTQVCRNINRIKICMETGQTVVLMNLENLYESLYDALNQYYVYLGGQRFVDLGLGTHRVKCKVHPEFRLIVVAEKQVVYKKFPIPLINRLEKHTLTMETVLTPVQLKMAVDLEHWAEAFLPKGVAQPHPYRKSEKGAQLGDTFIGYEKDTAASVVLQKSAPHGGDVDQHYIQILEECQRVLLQCATPESILRLKDSRLSSEETEIADMYFNQQKHDNIQQFIDHFVVRQTDTDRFIQVTTHSKLLSGAEVQMVGENLGMRPENIQLESLQAFDTEQQFCNQIRTFFAAEPKSSTTSLLILQCDSGDENSTLTASARYNILEAHRNERERHGQAGLYRKHVVFIVQLPRKKGGCFTGFEGGQWMSYHVDDLLPETKIFQNIHALRDKPISALFNDKAAVNSQLSLEVEMLSLDPLVDEPNINLDEPMDVDASEQVREQAAVGEILSPDVPEAELGLGAAGTQQVDVDELIRASMHGAAAMLEDENAQADRKTERVRMLMKLLDVSHDEESELTFMKVLHCRLRLLFKEKEKSVSGNLANKWLTKEAAAVDSIIKAGTFRRSVRQNLEEKVTPLLAGLIAFCDSNHNLNLLHETAPDCWLHTLWLGLLSAPAAARLTYQDLTSVKRDQELDRIQVRSHGPQGAHFRNQLPFSWLIKHKLEQLVHQAKQHHTGVGHEETVRRLFKQCAVGRVLDKVLEEGSRDEYLELYRHDFVKMMYKCESPHTQLEYQLVEDALVHLSAVGVDGPEEGPEPAVNEQLSETRLHFLYRAAKSRLLLFSQAVRLCPDIVTIIAEKGKQGNMFATTNDLTLDIQAFVILLEQLILKDELFKKEKERNVWLEKVESNRPFIEKMLDISVHPPIESCAFGDVCTRAFVICRAMWSRVCAMQLYLNHVCVSPTKDERHFTTDLCIQLWKLLGDDTDFKQPKTFNKLETFLKLCSGKTFKHYLGDGSTCPTCKNKVEEVVKVPCKKKHEVCLDCIKQYKLMGLNQCPECRDEIAETFQPVPKASKMKGKMASYKKYKQRCNSFFMEIISHLCFSGDEPPSEDVVGKLLGYVTKDPGIETGDDVRLFSKEMSLFTDTIDPTPAVRSFLLQLLLRSNIEDVRNHLEDFFKRGERVLVSDKEHKLKLCLLFMHCIEDSLFGQYQQKTNEANAVRYAVNLMKQASMPLLRANQQVIHKLEAIAQARVGLSVTAEWLHRLHCTKEILRVAPHDVKQLADAAAKLCDQNYLKWPRLHLLRLINKRYGMDVLKSLSEIKHLSWILPEEAKPKPGQKMVPTDRYMVYGKPYATVKAAIKIAIFSGDFQPVLDTLENEKSASKKETILLLALHRETTVYLIENQVEVLPRDKQKAVLNFVEQIEYVKQKDLARHIVLRDLDIFTNNLTSVPNSMMAELWLHFLILLSSADNGNKWLHPFIQLAKSPNNMAAAYLPTMPTDHTEEIRRATSVGHKMYLCPNGHPYIIGDCTQPVVNAICKGCGAEIGGLRYKLATGNKAAAETGDQTATGHILGKAETRSKTPIPERNLLSANVSLVRLLTHIAMHLGATENAAHVAPLIAPAVAANQVSQFLMKHIQLDMEVVSKALNRSPDECCVFIHVLLSSVLQVDQERNLDAGLRSQQSREQWETRFNEAVLSPCLTAIAARLQNEQNVMLEDSKADANPLLKILYETAPQFKDIEIEKIQECAHMWQFRTLITVDHLAQTLNENMSAAVRKKCTILTHFIQQEHLLRALRFVPDILRLQKLLIRRFNNSIDGAEATTMPVAEFLANVAEGPTRDEYAELIHSFQQAWTLVKEEFATFVCGNKPMPTEYQNINVWSLEDTPLSVLLPSWRGFGICSIAVLNLLASKQNDFLETYGRLTRISIDKGVNIQECTLANLIAYHPEKDLLPMVIATRNYTLLQGRDTQLEHDFEALQKQIEERFIKGKTRIVPDVELITFREDFTNAKVFEILNERIPQEPLGNTTAQQIAAEYRHMTDINHSLSLLDIAIGYLVSVDREPQMLLRDFMNDHLTLRSLLHSKQAQQVCCLSHVQSLWLLLSHVKAKHLQNNGHDAFDNVDESYKEELTPEMRAGLHAALYHTTVSSFMAELYECIVLHITAQRAAAEAGEDEDDTTNHNYPLGYSMQMYIEEKNGAEIPFLKDDKFPTELQFKHCTATWKEAFTFKQQTKRP